MSGSGIATTGTARTARRGFVLPRPTVVVIGVGARPMLLLLTKATATAATG